MAGRLQGGQAHFFSSLPPDCRSSWRPPPPGLYSRDSIPGGEVRDVPRKASLALAGGAGGGHGCHLLGLAQPPRAATGPRSSGGAVLAAGGVGTGGRHRFGGGPPSPLAWG